MGEVQFPEDRWRVEVTDACEARSPLVQGTGLECRLMRCLMLGGKQARDRGAERQQGDRHFPPAASPAEDGPGAGTEKQRVACDEVQQRGAVTFLRQSLEPLRGKSAR